MALRERLLPWDSQPQEAVPVDLSSRLAQVLQTAWIGTSRDGRDVFGRVVATPPTTAAVQPRQGGLALVGDGSTAASILAPKAVTGYPYVQIGYGYFASSGANYSLSYLDSSATGYTSVLRLHSSTNQVSAFLQYNFGTGRSVVAQLGASINVPVCMVLVVYSETDQRLWANGVAATGNLSPGTISGAGFNQVRPAAHNLNGGLYFSGFGSGQALADAEALAISANPALLWQVFEPQRAFVPVIAAAGGSTGTSAQTISLAGTSSGAVAVAGASAASIDLTGTAAGAAQITGTSSQAITLGGSATGVVPIGAASAATLALLAQSTGQIIISGASAGTILLLGSATGTTTGAVSGASDQVLPISGAAAGTVAVVGASAYTLQLSGSATGSVGAATITGQSAATLGLTGSGAGQILVRGASAATLYLVATPPDPFVADPMRTLLIAAELRALAIAAETRNLAIPAETRTVRITR